MTWKCINCFKIKNYPELKQDKDRVIQQIYCSECKCKTTHTKL